MRRWPEIRAGIIAIALFFGAVEGCPVAKQGEIPSFAEPIRDAQRVVLAPVEWIRMTFRVTQRWSLYQSPGTDRFRLWIDGQEPSGQWRILFRAADPVHDEDEALLDYTRPRGAWDPTSPRMPVQYALFARWVTHYMLAKHPDLIAARMRLERVTIAGDHVEFTNEFVHPYVGGRF
jgi:hypothetical protein